MSIKATIPYLSTSLSSGWLPAPPLTVALRHTIVGERTSTVKPASTQSWRYLFMMLHESSALSLISPGRCVFHFS